MNTTHGKIAKIPHMFAKALPSTKCPICDAPATRREIEGHLDNGCPTSVGCPRTESLPPPVPECNSNDNRNSIAENGENYLKNSKKEVELENEYENYFDDSDTEYEKVNLDTVNIDTGRETANNDEPIFRASQSVSNAPNRYGGLADFSTLGHVNFKNPSPKKPRFSSPFRHLSPSKKSPQKLNVSGAKKNLFSPEKQDTSSISALNGESEKPLMHVPFTQSKRQDPSHIPYYLTNFETILRGVIDETDDVRLFDVDDLQIVQTFRGLNLDSRKLYVRLFQRKFTWIRMSTISYEEVYDKDSALKSLISFKLINDSTKLNDLETVLHLLSAPNVKKLCKDLNVGTKGAQKQDGIEALLTHSKKKSFFISSKSGSIADLILNKALTMVEPSFCLEELPRKLFLRIFSLYSLSNWWDERENDKGQPVQLTTMLLQNTGRVIFPCYDIIREKQIFRDKNDLCQFEKSISFESRISEVIDSKQFENVIPIFEEANQFFIEILNDECVTSHIGSLPSFLRKFTSGSVMAYVLTKCMEIFERLKQHHKAVEILRMLLNQNLYLPDYHGLWYERLALDLDGHLKKPELALEAVEMGLNDEHVRVARKLTLCQRVVKICNTKKNSKLSEIFLQKFKSLPSWICPPDPPTKIIQGVLMPKENRPGAKTVFVYENVILNNGVHQKESLLCSVEEFVREHYKNELNFTHGLHGEGTVVNTIAGLLFWDIIYDHQVPDAFRAPHQAYPLDLNSDDFYPNRRDAIDKRLEEIVDWTYEQLSNFAAERWSKSCGISASMCTWEMFKGPDHLSGLLKCLTGLQWRAICERLIKHHRHTRSGFPDLTVWNPDLSVCHFVEVKGPNDRLSAKQILWMEFLNSHGITSVVCHVEATNAKKLAMSRSPAKTKNSPSPAKCSPKNSQSPRKSSPKKSPKKKGKGHKLNHPDRTKTTKIKAVKQTAKEKAANQKRTKKNDGGSCEELSPEKRAPVKKASANGAPAKRTSSRNENNASKRTRYYSSGDDFAD